MTITYTCRAQQKKLSLDAMLWVKVMAFVVCWYLFVLMSHDLNATVVIYMTVCGIPRLVAITIQNFYHTWWKLCVSVGALWSIDVNYMMKQWCWRVTSWSGSTASTKTVIFSSSSTSLSIIIRPLVNQISCLLSSFRISLATQTVC